MDKSSLPIISEMVRAPCGGLRGEKHMDYGGMNSTVRRSWGLYAKQSYTVYISDMEVTSLIF